MYEFVDYTNIDGDVSSRSRRSSVGSSRYNYPPEETENLKASIVDDVRIIPPMMIFSDAYDGKVFNQSFSVMNCGKYPALVRILAPSSKAFKLKPIPKGHTISAGLSIIRKITYTHSSAMGLPQACLLIYINNKPIMYQLKVHIISPHVTINPSSLDFGDVDAGTASEPMCLHLLNKGHKITYFTVDLGRSNLELIVEPMRGTIRPLEDVEIKVEVLGSKLGSFTKEFWIKTEPPQRVNISGSFIKPRLVIEHPKSTFKFVLLDFPRTYLGAEITRTLVIRNNSSVATMFCIVSEYETGFKYLKEAMETSEDLKCFNIAPKEGRLQAQQNYILKFTFAPKNAKNLPQMVTVAFIRVMQVHYRDGIIEDAEFEAKTFRTANDSDMDLLGMSSQQTCQECYMEEEEEVGLDELGDDYLRICLYGEMEEARIKLTPQSYSIAYLRPNVKYSYELNIKNMSKLLPIIVQYNKSACIDVEPKKITLEPDSSVEVVLSIKPTKIGETDANIVFDLIYEGKQERCKVGTASLPIHYVSTMACPYIEPRFNMGITPRITNEVGFLVDDIRFNSAVEKPIQAIVDKKHKNFNANNCDLIAFPNDRPKGLRPWKNDVPCRTIYANISRFVNKQDEYTLNSAEIDMKKYTKQMYVDYIRSEGIKRQEKNPLPHLIPHYSISKEKRILMEGVHFGECVKEKTAAEIFGYTGTPLPPERLFKVNIYPKIVGLGEIAPYTVCTDSFFIENNNEFAIHVIIKALSNSVVIKGKKMMTIGPNTTKNIFFDCWSYGLGKYYVPVFVIVNDCHIFDATVYAKVVPTTVVCPNEEIIINPRLNMTFFEIYNPVNCDISFSWDVQDENFDMYPLSGTIPSRRSLYCRLTFIPKIEAVYQTEIYLLSQNGAKQIIKVTRVNDKAPMAFDTYSVKFENIPLNIPIPKELILRNFSDTNVVYIVTNPHPVKEISITPVKGKVAPKADAFIEIVAHFQNVVNFNCQVTFLLQDAFTYVIDIQGNVVFPELRIEPESIQIPKIISGSYRRRVIRIWNESQAQTFINFCFEDFPELCMTDMDKNIVDEVVLESEECTELFLEFRPNEATVYSMFLPFIINGMIGPAAMNDLKSTDPKSYFEEVNNGLETAVELPESLPLVRLRCAAGQPWAKMSSLNINFPCYDKRSRYLVITNISTADHQVTIPSVDAYSPFHYDIDRADTCDMTHKYCNIFMEPKDEVVIEFVFSPSDYGSYKIELPMFVDKNFNPCPFNYVCLSGWYAKPVMTCNKNILFFQIISLKDQVSEDLYLELVDHERDCAVSTEVLNDTFSVIISEETKLDSSKSRIAFTVTFTSKQECYVESNIIFSCTCGASFTLVAKAAADNSFFGSYESFIKNKALMFSQHFESTFPYFPDPSDSYYASKMNLMLSDVEYWMYSQAFFYKSYFNIPEGICRVPIEIGKSDAKENRFSKKPAPQLPLVKMLVNLMGGSIAKYFNDESLVPVFEGVEGAIYLYATYRNILSFLKTQNVFVPPLEPEFLLPYRLYVTFKEQVQNSVGYANTPTEEKILLKEKFLAISTQCWMDLVLRIFKKFVFHRSVAAVTVVPSHKKHDHHRKHDIYNDEFMEYFSNNKKDLMPRHELEVKLLVWLQFHFEKQKALLWDLKVHQNLQKPRVFKSFELDLWDGLAFGTLLAAYCPYLKKVLQNFYPEFENEEQMFHNFCLIHQMMRKINLSYVLTPPHLVKPSTAEMIMTVAYLYDVLPGFLPAETITLETSLGESISHEIILKNTGSSTIAYTPIFFHNDTNDFVVDSESVVINAKKQVVVKITYIAKSVLPKDSTLLLSGETSGFKYATSMAVRLVGIPKIFDFTNEYSFKVDTYASVQKKIDIDSPYEREYQAKLYLYLGDGTKMPETIEDFVPVSDFVDQNIPREICSDPDLHFDSDGIGTLTANFCFVSCGEFIYFAYFLNDEVGDFCVKIKILAEMTKKNAEDIEVLVPYFFSPEIPCTCAQEWGVRSDCRCAHFSENCPKLINIPVPFANDKIVESLRMMLAASVVPSEFEFWNSLLDTPKGFHVFRNYLVNSFKPIYVRFQCILSPKVTYRVGFSRKKVSCPQTVTIDDVTASGVFQLPIHWNAKEEPQEEVLKLYADHNQEIRQYKLIFKRQDDNM